MSREWVPITRVGAPRADLRQDGQAYLAIKLSSAPFKDWTQIFQRDGEGYELSRAAQVADSFLIREISLMINPDDLERVVEQLDTRTAEANSRYEAMILPGIRSSTEEGKALAQVEFQERHQALQARANRLMP